MLTFIAIFPASLILANVMSHYLTMHEIADYAFFNIMSLFALALVFIAYIANIILFAVIRNWTIWWHFVVGVSLFVLLTVIPLWQIFDFVNLAIKSDMRQKLVATAQKLGDGSHMNSALWATGACCFFTDPPILDILVYDDSGRVLKSEDLQKQAFAKLSLTTCESGRISGYGLLPGFYILRETCL